MNVQLVVQNNMANGAGLRILSLVVLEFKSPHLYHYHFLVFDMRCRVSALLLVSLIIGPCQKFY